MGFSGAVGEGVIPEHKTLNLYPVSQPVNKYFFSACYILGTGLSGAGDSGGHCKYCVSGTSMAGIMTAMSSALWWGVTVLTAKPGESMERQKHHTAIGPQEEKS